MQKNWYIVYTKPGREKKTAALLAKRKITNFYPLKCKETGLARRKKRAYEPLFSSYVFVNTTATELGQLKQIAHVLNLVYWKGQPAIISENEINSIKNFSEKHRNIKLIPSKVVENEVVNINSPSYYIESNVISVKNTILKINLPSLGFDMIAEIESDKLIRNEIAFESRHLVFQYN